jgi:hypothetical protein
MPNNICYSCFKPVYGQEAFDRGGKHSSINYYKENCSICGSDNAFYYANNDELQKAKEIFDKKPKEIKKERKIGLLGLTDKECDLVWAFLREKGIIENK